jgi:hypothetical protein
MYYVIHHDKGLIQYSHFKAVVEINKKIWQCHEGVCYGKSALALGQVCLQVFNIIYYIGKKRGESRLHI